MLLSLSRGLTQGPLAGIAQALMLLLGAIFSVLTIITYGALGVAAGGVSRWLAAHPTYMRNVNRASAARFIASGAAVLLLDRRR